MTEGLRDKARGVADPRTPKSAPPKSLRPKPAASPPRPAARKASPPPVQTRLMAAARVEFIQHGFAGARVDRILARAKANPRMLYHHFGGKSQLYVAVLEEALAGLRKREMKLDVEAVEPIEGLLELFDFMNDHFEADPGLVRLLTNENLMKAQFMRMSDRIREMSSPVLSLIDGLILRSKGIGGGKPGLDPLRLYVLMVALSQFHLSNAHTLSVIFDRDLSDRAWMAERRADARRMLHAFLLSELAPAGR